MATSITSTGITFPDATSQTTAVNDISDLNSNISDTELGYLNGVTSAIQTQLNTITANDWVTAARIADNAVGAAALNISGNGTSGQMLTSDGDGSFSWTAAPSGGQDAGIAWFNSSGNWTVPSNVKSVRVTVVGGGGSGGTAQTYLAGCGGGGGGGACMGSVNGLNSGTSISVTVGGTGGTSSFGTYMTASGGGTASNVSGWGQQSTGASGGSGSGGSYNTTGNSGGNGYSRFEPYYANGGVGGYAKIVPYAPIESRVPYQGTIYGGGYGGHNGTWYGGGGHGAATQGNTGDAGGTGYQGVVVLEW